MRLQRVATLVSIIAGSDKTVASIVTGHQEFHPLYIGPGNIDNPTQCVHGNGILLCAFLPIPKGRLLDSTLLIGAQFGFHSSQPM